MPKLHVFLDESGDFGFKEHSTKRFILSFVFHDEREDLSRNFGKISSLGYVHLGPLIRKEPPYEEFDLMERTKIFRRFFAFFVSLPIKCASFVYEKRLYEGEEALLERKIEDDLGMFFSLDNPYLAKFDSIVLYYDKGQRKVSSILRRVLSSSGFEYSLKEDVKATDYRLFQAADLIAMMKLLESKMGKEGMSQSEKKFFGKPRRFKKEYLEAIKKKEILP